MVARITYTSHEIWYWVQPHVLVWIFIVPWQLCQEYMALMIPHLLGLFYFMSNRLSVCGTHIFPCNGPESPFLDTDKVYLIIHFCWNAFDFDILSLLISFLLPLSKSSDIKQSNFSLFFLMCTYHLLSDIIRFKDGSLFLWCMHAFLCQFFWFISLNASPSSSMVYSSISFFPTGAGFHPCLFWKNIYLSLIFLFASYLIEYRIVMRNTSSEWLY